MPHICHICQLLYVQISDNYVSIYPHMDPMQSIMSPGMLVYIHFTLLTYAPEQNMLATLQKNVSLPFYCNLPIDTTFFT